MLVIVWKMQVARAPPRKLSWWWHPARQILSKMNQSPRIITERSNRSNACETLKIFFFQATSFKLSDWSGIPDMNLWVIVITKPYNLGETRIRLKHTLIDANVKQASPLCISETYPAIDAASRECPRKREDFDSLISNFIYWCYVSHK